MEDFELDLVIGEGPSARSVKIGLSPFTPGRRHHPLRPDHHALARPLHRYSGAAQFYTAAELCKIVLSAARRCWAPA